MGSNEFEQQLVFSTLSPRPVTFKVGKMSEPGVAWMGAVVPLVAAQVFAGVLYFSCFPTPKMKAGLAKKIILAREEGWLIIPSSRTLTKDILASCSESDYQQLWSCVYGFLTNRALAQGLGDLPAIEIFQNLQPMEELC